MKVGIDIFTIVCVSVGVFFYVAGTIGLLRFPDSLSRLHALTKADNLGLGLVALAILPRAPSVVAAFKIIVVWALVLLSGAATAQLIGSALRRDRR